MIRPLRQRHRRMVLVLGIFLPTAFAGGIAARKSVPGMASLPGELIVSTEEFTVTEWERADLFKNSPIQVRLVRERASTGRFAVKFSTVKDFVKPDLIVYWVVGSPNITNTLPDNAQLLGAFDPGNPLPLTQQAGSGSGMLVLYSLADQAIIETSIRFSLP